MATYIEQKVYSNLIQIELKSIFLLPLHLLNFPVENTIISYKKKKTFPSKIKSTDVLYMIKMLLEYRYTFLAIKP